MPGTLCCMRSAARDRRSSKPRGCLSSARAVSARRSCYYLAAAGIGTIGIIDHDTVSVSNLQRQILHTTARVGMAKTASAREALLAINPHVR